MCVCVSEREIFSEIFKKKWASTAIFGISVQGVAGVTVFEELAAAPQSESHVLHEM